MECPICFEHRKCEVTCPHCAFASCKDCTRLYILSLVEEAQCMKCHAAYTLEFIQSSLGKTWFTREYQNRRRDVLFEQFKGSLHLYQEKAKAILEHKRLRKEIQPLRTAVRERERIWWICRANDVEYQRLRRNLSQMDIRIFNLWQFVGSPALTMKMESEPVRKKNIFHCPLPECLGYVEDGICGICLETICVKCRCKHGEESCDPEHVKSIQAILDSTRECPKCKTPVHRISGCSQMWCTICHTAFNYITGEVERGIVHNPHLMEWLRRNRIHENPEEGECNITAQRINDHIERCGISLNMEREIPIRRIRVGIVYSIFRYAFDDSLRRALDIISKLPNISSKAARFLLGNFKERSLRSSLWTHRKQEIRRERNIELINLIHRVGIDILSTFLQAPPTEELFNTTVDTIIEFTEQINRTFLEISHSMGYKKALRMSGFIIQPTLVMDGYPLLCMVDTNLYPL